MNKNVVIITYDMIPNSISWGGCQRMYYLACQLHRDGYNATVFSCNKKANNTFGNPIPFDIKPLDIKNRLMRAILNPNQKADGLFQETDPLKPSLVQRIKNTLKNSGLFFKLLRKIEKIICNEPNFFQGFISKSWCNGAKDEIISFICENGVKNVIISAPPFGMFWMSTYIRKKFRNINVILDYRDPWNMWDKGSLISKERERKALVAADNIVCTTEYLARDMAAAFSIPEQKFTVIANGYSEDNWYNISVESSTCAKMVITYVGTIDYHQKGSYRDTSKLFDAFEKMLIEGRPVLLRFVGVINPNTEVVRCIKGRFKENVEIMGIVDSKKAAEYMLCSDVLLLLHTTEDNSAKYIISGKMYDYIKAGKAILSIGSKDGIHCRMVQEHNFGVHSDNDEDEIFSKLTHLYALWTESKLNKYVNIDNSCKYSREYQNAKYIEMLS